MSLPDGSYQPFSISLRDAGNEIGTMRGYGTPLTAANFDAQVTAFGNLVTAVEAVVLGGTVKTEYAHTGLFDPALPTNGAARETKLLVQYKDGTNGQRFTLTIPSIDPTIPVYIDNVSAQDAISMTTPAGITGLIDAIEAFVKPPVNPTHAVVVIGLKVVGRNT